MRVIAGTAKGKKLFSGTVPGLRPIMDRVKESVFEHLTRKVPGSRVADLFAGTGAIGIEALSRGAARASFVDRAPEAIKLIRQNVEHTGFGPQAELHGEECGVFLMTTDQQFDIMFLDPPFADFTSVAGGLLDRVRQRSLLAAGGLVVLRHFFKDACACPGFDSVFEKRYGENTIRFLRLTK